MPEPDTLDLPAPTASAEPGALVALGGLVPAQVFRAGGIDPILHRIAEMARAVSRDTSTRKGREEIASVAYKVAQAKARLDDMGKELVSGIKQQAAVVDAERRRMREFLDSLKEEVRAPLTQWEREEEKRKALLADRVEAIKAAGRARYKTAADAQAALRDLASIEIGDAFAERQAEAELAVQAGIEALEQHRQELERAEAEAAARAAAEAEAARLREEIAARERAASEAEERAARAEREAAEARAAAERAEREAAEKAERARAEAIEREERAKREAEERERRKQADEEAARLRAEEAERQREEAEKRAAEEAERRAAAAVEAERRRVAEQQAAAEAEAARRAADVERRRAVNGAAATAIADAAGIDIEAARKVVMAIVQGEVPHVTITY